MPEVIIYALEGRTPETKLALAKDITEAVTKHLGVPAENVMVQIVESSRDSKFRGGAPFSQK
ncbi:tautomerase family protein [Devosia sp.]|uniref:tautomerase family protein n=1 Tax=Devosia sp. TaxID=1871048 RepID=UPI003266E0F9